MNVIQAFSNLWTNRDLGVGQRLLTQFETTDVDVFPQRIYRSPGIITSITHFTSSITSKKLRRVTAFFFYVAYESDNARMYYTHTVSCH